MAEESFAAAAADYTTAHREKRAVTAEEERLESSIASHQLNIRRLQERYTNKQRDSPLDVQLTLLITAS